MPATIRVNNQIGVKGDISGIIVNSDNSTDNESFSAWKSKYPNRDLSEYHRNFIFIHVTDVNVDDLVYLTETLLVDDNPIGNRYSFLTPNESSSEWSELFNTGEISKILSEVLVYLVDNS